MRILKKVLFFVGVVWLGLQSSYSQGRVVDTSAADSLFASKKYTQALRIYETALSNNHKVSPAMLLKMAFVREGLGDYTKALYYLNLYYTYRPSEMVIEKMDELADANKLAGYEFDDINFIMIFYDRYFMYIAFALLVFGTYIFSVIVFKRVKKEHIPVRHGIAFMIYLGGAFVFLNLSSNQHKAIVHRDNVYLMDAPSAGASLVRVIKKGHRLEVVDKNDIWLEVEWENKRAYVRQQNVWLIN